MFRFSGRTSSRNLFKVVSAGEIADDSGFALGNFLFGGVKFGGGFMKVAIAVEGNQRILPLFAQDFIGVKLTNVRRQEMGDSGNVAVEGGVTELLGGFTSAVRRGRT